MGEETERKEVLCVYLEHDLLHIASWEKPTEDVKRKQFLQRFPDMILILWAYYDCVYLAVLMQRSQNPLSD